jgi:hypothetical protein
MEKYEQVKLYLEEKITINNAFEIKNSKFHTENELESPLQSFKLVKKNNKIIKT